MNKLSYLATLLLLSVTIGIMAQAPTGTPDANYSIYKNKLKKSDEGLSDPKKNVTPKFWISRAELMMDIFELNRKFIAQGTQELHVNLIYQNPLQTRDSMGADGSVYKILVFDKITIWMKNGVVDRFVETVKLHETPLAEALKCLEKAQELDVENKSAKAIKEDYGTLKKHFERYGIEEFFKPAYDMSFNAFKTIDYINQKPVMQGVIDTTMLYYTGMAASRAGLLDEAINYYEKAIANNYKEPEIYVYLKEKYYEKATPEDSIKGFKVLESGFERFPNSQAILIELINYYLMSNQSDAALEYLRRAQEDDPENVSFIFAEATLYDKKGDTEKALATYNQCIAKDPAYFNAYYNLGVMFYNQAVELYKKADAMKNPKDYDAAKADANVVLAKALPYMEKANEIADANTDWPEETKRENVKATLETLKTLYIRLQMNDKFQLVNEELSQY